MAKQSNFEFRYEFLGREFLTWLWFASERDNGNVKCGDLRVRVELSDALTIESAGNIREATQIRAECPSQTEEARTALRVGKKVARAKLGLDVGERRFEVTIDSGLHMSAVRLPTLMAGDDAMKMEERLRLLSELEAIVFGLYSDFLTLRTGDGWQTESRAIGDWVQEVA